MKLQCVIRGVTAPINEVLEGLADLLEISPKLLEGFQNLLGIG